MKQVCAEDLPYWKSGQSAPDTWIARAKQEIVKAGATNIREGYGAQDGKAAFLLAFSLAGEEFKITWPVMLSKSGNERAARIQAATMLYHDVKSRAVAARVQGARSSFLGYLVLDTGQTAGQATGEDLSNVLPAMFNGPKLLTG